jgi:hypothetical protein
MKAVDDVESLFVGFEVLDGLGKGRLGQRAIVLNPAGAAGGRIESLVLEEKDDPPWPSGKGGGGGHEGPGMLGKKARSKGTSQPSGQKLEGISAAKGHDGRGEITGSVVF